MRHLRLILTSVVIVAVAALYRIFGLQAQPESFEEIAAIMLGRSSISEYLASPLSVFCPPLHFVVMKVLGLYSAPLWVARSGSVMLGVFAAVGTYWIMRRRYGSRAAASAGFLVALSPLHIMFSREAVPAAMVSMLLLVAFHLMLRASETNRLKYWIMYDVVIVALLHSHSGALSLVLALGVAQTIRIMMFEDIDAQRRLKRRTRMLAMLFNFVIVACFSLPWLIVGPVDSPWPLPPFNWIDPVRSLLDWPLFGLRETVKWYYYLFPAVLLLLFLPPLLRLLRDARAADVMAVVTAALMLIMPALLGIGDKPPYQPRMETVLVVPLLALAVGVILARCNAYVRVTMSLLLVAGLVAANMRGLAREPRPDFNDMAQAASDRLKPDDTVVFFPDYASVVGSYYFGTEVHSVSALDFFRTEGLPETSGRTKFAVFQFPTRTEHLYTFPSALKMFAKSETIWSRHRNMLMESTTIDRPLLNLWYQDPKLARVVDTRTSSTQFLFTPSDRIFSDERFEKQFHTGDRELQFERDGRIVLWSKQERVELVLPVNLQPGNYELVLHCGANFEYPAAGVKVDRAVALNLRSGEDIKKLPRVSESTFVRLPFATEFEVRDLRVQIEVDPLLTVTTPRRLNLGFKMYSIAIESTDGAGAL